VPCLGGGAAGLQQRSHRSVFCQTHPARTSHSQPPHPSYPPTLPAQETGRTHKSQKPAMVRCCSTTLVLGAAALLSTTAQFNLECGLGETPLYIQVHGTDKLTECTDYFDDVDPYAVVTVGQGMVVVCGGVCWTGLDALLFTSSPLDVRRGGFGVRPPFVRSPFSKSPALSLPLPSSLSLVNSPIPPRSSSPSPPLRPARRLQSHQDHQQRCRAHLGPSPLLRLRRRKHQNFLPRARSRVRPPSLPPSSLPFPATP